MQDDEKEETVIATQHDGPSGLVVLFALGLIALQIYLIYAIIATRQDVLEIKRLLRAGLSPGSGRTVGASMGSTVGSGVIPPIPGVAERPAAKFAVVLRAGGASPAAVESVLMKQAAYLKSGAKGAVKNPGQRLLVTDNAQAAQDLADAIEAAGGSVDIVTL